MLATAPSFHPDTDASPRLVDLFANARRKVAPDALKSMYTRARGLLDSKDREGAIKAFTDVVQLAADPDLKDDKTVAELALLANGFLELSRALPAPAPARPDAAAASSSVGANPSASRQTAPVISQPVPLHEELPKWFPPASLARAEFRGKVVVHIGVDGAVESAEILESVHPLYDQQLLTASKHWLYKPGTSNGAAVPSERTVEVVLKPRLNEPQ